jgi:tRNA pseudouridine55 synthase
VGRVTDGILVIDKPEGMTSAAVVSRVKKMLGVRKIGHTGTLDPFATGILICCVNRATRISQFFLHGDKTYEGVLCLGTETDSQDRTGNITAVREVVTLSDQDLKRAVLKFKGTVRQNPPVYSALKHQGVPLYKLAREGRPVQKPPREVFIYDLDILEIALPDVRFRVSCSSGTYIRTLAADIGGVLGCGGHLKALRRTESSGFTLNDSLTLEELKRFGESGNVEGRVIPMSRVLTHIPLHEADEQLAQRIRTGIQVSDRDIPIPETGKNEGYLRVMDSGGGLLAVLNYKKGRPDYNYCCVFN